MKFFAVVALLAAAATAAPELKARVAYPSIGETPINIAEESCGKNLEVHCCNKEDHSTKVDNNSGILSGVLGNVGGSNGGLGIFDGCSPLTVNAVAGLDLLKNHCKQTVACCQNSPSNANGVVAVALPCIALAGLLQ